MLKALIFDFDGLILDTETPEVDIWQSIYHEHGYELPVDEWAMTIGGYGISTFDPAIHLSQLTALDPAPLRERYRTEAEVVIHAKDILPGVVDMIADGKKRGLKLAVASSSPHSWVDAHLARLNLIQQFDKIICSDDVPPGRTKPNPDLFLLALDQLQVERDAAVIFEDSPNGVKAAQSAGVFVVAVPNPLTKKFGVSGDLTVDSLSELSLDRLMRLFTARL